MATWLHGYMAKGSKGSIVEGFVDWSFSLYVVNPAKNIKNWYNRQNLGYFRVVMFKWTKFRLYFS